jgi:hypothetical protein
MCALKVQRDYYERTFDDILSICFYLCLFTNKSFWEKFQRENIDVVGNLIQSGIQRVIETSVTFYLTDEQSLAQEISIIVRNILINQFKKIFNNPYRRRELSIENNDDYFEYLLK